MAILISLLQMPNIATGAFCRNADGCRREGGRGQKSVKFADVLNEWSLSRFGSIHCGRIYFLNKKLEETHGRRSKALETDITK